MDSEIGLRDYIVKQTVACMMVSTKQREEWVEETRDLLINSIIKAKIARRENGEIAFQHALRQLTENEYQRILSRIKINGSSTDYVRVNGQPYVVGESAERHGVLTQRSGAARYTRDLRECRVWGLR